MRHRRRPGLCAMKIRRGSVQNPPGCPSIRAKVLSSTNYPWRCVSIAMFAREVEDEDSGKHLYLNHPFVESFCFCCCFCFCRSTNHRFGPTATMILLFEHPTQVGCESAQSTLRAVLAAQGHPRAALDANDLRIRLVGAKHPEESYSQLARHRHLGHGFRFLVAPMQILTAKL